MQTSGELEYQKNFLLDAFYFLFEFAQKSYSNLRMLEEFHDCGYAAHIQI